MYLFRLDNVDTPLTWDQIIKHPRLKEAEVLEWVKGMGWVVV